MHESVSPFPRSVRKRSALKLHMCPGYNRAAVGRQCWSRGAQLWIPLVWRYSPARSSGYRWTRRSTRDQTPPHPCARYHPLVVLRHRPTWLVRARSSHCRHLLFSSCSSPLLPWQLGPAPTAEQRGLFSTEPPSLCRESQQVSQPQMLDCTFP